jgi:hypothetical protein
VGGNVLSIKFTIQHSKKLVVSLCCRAPAVMQRPRQPVAAAAPVRAALHAAHVACVQPT